MCRSVSLAVEDIVSIVERREHAWYSHHFYYVLQLLAHRFRTHAPDDIRNRWTNILRALLIVQVCALEGDVRERYVVHQLADIVLPSDAHPSQVIENYN